MMYDTILARSFSKHDQKKLGFGAFLGCLIIALSICFVFKPYLDPTKIVNLQAPTDAGLKMLMTDEVSNPFLPKSSPNQSKYISNDEEKSIPIRKSIPNQLKSIPNQEVIIPNEEKGVSNQESIPNEEKSNPIQEISIPNEAKSNTNEEMSLANEEKSIPVQETSIANEKTSNAIEEKSIPNQETSNANKEKSNPNEERSTPNEKSIPNQERNTHQKDIQTKEFKPICNLSLPRSDICQMSGDIRVHSKSSTIFVPSTINTSTNSPQNSTTSWTIRPYARKEDATAMENVRNFTVKMVTKSSSSRPSSPENVPSCTHNHNVTGILFSTGGYVGNHFHELTDVVIPLYLTSREFNGQVQFLVTNKNIYWINKYKTVLDKLSKYEIIDIDREKEEEKVHCFPSMFVGLKQHKELRIDPSRSPHSMTEFRKFLREAYSLKRQTAWTSSSPRTIKQKQQPCLLIVARRRTRRFTNEEEIEKMARRIGFRVVVTEGDSNLARFSRIVNSCDVMMGVHGAGLTNIVFLPENGVLIQVVPLGASDWLTRTYFGEPAKTMKLKYLEYKIGEEESSLREQYPPDHPVFRNPISVSKHGWLAFKEVYLDKQNVKLDVERFKPTLLEALKLLREQ